MKIAMFTNLFAPLVGGTERSVATFAEDLRGLGHDVLVVTWQQEGTPASERGILRLPFPSQPEDGILGDFAPDAIHAHQPFLIGALAFRLAASRGLPFVHTHHTLHARPEDRVALSALAPLEETAKDLAIACSNHSHAVIAPTGSIASILKSQGIRGDISILPTGIDTKAFSRGDGSSFRRRHDLPSNAFVVGHLGRLVPAKRAVYLAEAVSTFLSGSPQARALFCGEGESAGDVRARFAEAGVEDRLALLGELPDAEVPDAYAAMDLFAFASLTDTQGLVLLEAMAAGTPVLALRATGPQDLFPDGHGGRLLDPDAPPAAFAAAIAELAASSLRTSLSAAARRRAAAFDRGRCARRLLSIYEKAIARARHGGPPAGVLAPLQAKVEREWDRILRSGASPALLHSRGFPSVKAAER